MRERERERVSVRERKRQSNQKQLIMYHAVCYFVPHCQKSKSKNQNKGTDWNETEQKYE